MFGGQPGKRRKGKKGCEEERRVRGDEGCMAAAEKETEEKKTQLF